MIKTYYNLTKPGIIMGNVMTAIGGFLLASKESAYSLLFLTMAGLSLVIASACVFNNYMDRDADKQMIRTRNRALVKGDISNRSALLFASILGVLGTSVLAFFTNALTTCAALLGFFVYVFLYSPWKYKSSHGTLIGSIAGGAPPLVGYFAAAGKPDIGALLLCSSVVLWQMPHFYAIAMYRLKDYATASIPVLPVVKGNHVTKIHMLLYIIGFLAATVSLTLFGYTGYVYLIITTVLGSVWFYLSLKGFSSKNDTAWARKMFIFSLLIITSMCILMALDPIVRR